MAGWALTPHPHRKDVELVTGLAQAVDSLEAGDALSVLHPSKLSCSAVCGGPLG